MWRIGRRILIVGSVLVAVAGTGWYLYGASCRSRFEEQVAALRAAGHPTRFEDLATPPVPDEENGVKLLEQATRILAEREKAPDSADRLLWQREQPVEEIVAIATYLDSLAPYFQLLEQVPARPHWRPDVDWSEGMEVVLGHVGELANACHLLEARARFDLEIDGRTERAAATAVLLMDLGRKCRGPCVMGHAVWVFMTSTAVRVLRNAIREPGFEAALFRRVVDPRLAQAIPDRGPGATMFIEERVYLIAYVRAMDKGGLPELVEDRSEYGKSPLLDRPRLYRDACLCLDIVQEGIERSDTTPDGALGVGADFRARYPGDARRDMVTSYATLNAVSFEKFGARVAAFRLARVVMALLEHRQREGAWPETLDALGEMPLDPYGGKPFLYERTEHGCRVRSAKEDSDERLEDRDLLWILDDDQIPAMAR